MTGWVPKKTYTIPYVSHQEKPFLWSSQASDDLYHPVCLYTLLGTVSVCSVRSPRYTEAFCGQGFDQTAEACRLI